MFEKLGLAKRLTAEKRGCKGGTGDTACKEQEFNETAGWVWLKERG